MDGQKNATCDLDLLNRLKPLSFLSPDALRELASGLNSANFRRREVILPEEALAAGVHILLRGVAKIACLSQTDERVTIALLAPGPIPIADAYSFAAGVHILLRGVAKIACLSQ